MKDFLAPGPMPRSSGETRGRRRNQRKVRRMSDSNLEDTGIEEVGEATAIAR